MRVGAIRYEAREGEVVDDVLRASAARLKAEGFQLSGSVQINVPHAGLSRCDMNIEDLASGVLIEASDKTRGANGCRLDAYALEDAAGLVAQSISSKTDLLIINRFGKQEALGQGFRAAIEAAVMIGVPVLTSFSSTNASAFDAFSGGHAEILPADADQIAAWCKVAIGAHRAE
jgi:nucleoside-triphosphatase THEP1